MTGADMVGLLQSQFGPAITEARPEAIDPFVTVGIDHLREISRFLRDDPRLKFELLNCVTGVDYLETDAKKVAKAGFEPHLEVVYHFSSFTHNHRFTLKLTMPRWRDNIEGQLPEVPSIADLYPTADWHERETFDLLGVRFTGHPDLRRILMAEDWDGHPLRKDYEFPLEYHGIRCR